MEVAVSGELFDLRVQALLTGGGGGYTGGHGGDSGGGGGSFSRVETITFKRGDFDQGKIIVKYIKT